VSSAGLIVPAIGGSEGPKFIHSDCRHQKRRWWQKYWQTILAACMQVGIAAYVALVNLVNPAPDASGLVHFEIKVVRFDDLAPHLLVQLEDGTRKWLEFPTALSIRPNRFSRVSRAQRLASEGCTGQVSGVEMRLVERDRFRVWEIDCGLLSIPFNDMRDYFRRSMDAGCNVYIAYLVAGFSFCLFVFFVDRKGK
jgi:hypothetical protein